MAPGRGSRGARTPAPGPTTRLVGGGTKGLPRPLISVRDALDPDRKRPELFCNLGDRDRTAQAMAREPGRKGAIVRTATTTFDYPVLSDDLSSATVEHQGSNDAWTADGPGDFVASGRTVLLEKKAGRWRIKKMTDAWVAN